MRTISQSDLQVNFFNKIAEHRLVLFDLLKAVIQLSEGKSGVLRSRHLFEGEKRRK